MKRTGKHGPCTDSCVLPCRSNAFDGPKYALEKQLHERGMYVTRR